jgi:hypothetical protein
MNHDASEALALWVARWRTAPNDPDHWRLAQRYARVRVMLSPDAFAALSRAVGRLATAGRGRGAPASLPFPRPVIALGPGAGR